jgi:nucleotide-binding universal stress UspA family protein
MQVPMDELVVGVDGSERSRMALRWAAAVGGAVDVPVRAVQSWIHPRAALLPIAPVPMVVEEVEEHTRQATAEVVAEVLASSSGSAEAEAEAVVMADVKVEVFPGQPAGALLEAVGPDSVLVVGSRGLGGFRGLLLGSVSQECVEYAACPVVVVRTERLVAPGDVILVGKDGSEGAQQALAWARTLADATGATVRAVHAWRAGESERPPRTEERRRSRAAVEDWVQQVDDDIETEEVEGDPRDVLVAAAERYAPALVVVGRRGAGGLRSMRLGSTANHLARHGSTNVAVVAGA